MALTIFKLEIRLFSKFIKCLTCITKITTNSDKCMETTECAMHYTQLYWCNNELFYSQYYCIHVYNYPTFNDHLSASFIPSINSWHSFSVPAQTKFEFMKSNSVPSVLYTTPPASRISNAPAATSHGFKSST